MIGPPNWDKSTLDIAVTFNWTPSHTPAPTNISPVLPVASTKPSESNMPNSSPGSNVVIIS